MQPKSFKHGSVLFSQGQELTETNEDFLTVLYLRKSIRTEGQILAETGPKLNPYCDLG